MKEDIAFRQSKRLGHTRQHFNLMTALAEWAISDAGGHDKVFGKKPGVAEFTPTDLSAETGRAVKGNLANISEIQALLEKILPGYKNIVGTESKNIQSLLRGEIPEDLRQSIQRTSAFRSLSGGYAGSGMSKSLTARDLGRTSLDLIERGGNAAQRWMQGTQNSVAPFIVTSAQQAAQTERNNLYRQATEQHRLNVEAAPDPGAAGQFNLQTALGSQAMSFGLGSAAGAMGGSRTAPAAAPATTTYVMQPAPATTYNYGPWDQGYRWGGG